MCVCKVYPVDNLFTLPLGCDMGTLQEFEVPVGRTSPPSLFNGRSPNPIGGMVLPSPPPTHGWPRSQGFTVGNHQIFHACTYPISEHFYVWVITARRSLLHPDESRSRAHIHLVRTHSSLGHANCPGPWPTFAPFYTQKEPCKKLPFFERVFSRPMKLGVQNTLSTLLLHDD